METPELIRDAATTKTTIPTKDITNNPIIIKRINGIVIGSAIGETNIASKTNHIDEILVLIFFDSLFFLLLHIQIKFEMLFLMG